MEIRRAKVICMASAKGGAGKTVLTVTFSTFLAALKKKVLLIDTDAATNGLTLMFLREMTVHKDFLISKEIVPAGVYDFPENGAFSTQYINLPSNIEFLPASYNFSNTEDVDFNIYRDKLEYVIQKARTKFDYIFIDAQAGSDQFASFSMSRKISDEVVIVSEYDPLSAAGVERLKALFNKDLTYERTWVLLNKMLPEFVKSFSTFLEVARYLSPLPWDATVVMAYSRRKLALDLEKVNDFTLSVAQTLKSLLGDEIEPELQTWLSERTGFIKDPIKSELEQYQSKLDAMYSLKQKEERRLTLKKWWLVFGSCTFLIAAVVIITNFIHKDFDKILSSKFTVKDIFSVIAALLAPVIVSISMSEAITKLIKDSPLQKEHREDEILYLKERVKRLKLLSDAPLEELVKIKDKVIN